MREERSIEGKTRSIMGEKRSIQGGNRSIQEETRLILGNEGGDKLPSFFYAYEFQKSETI